MLNSINNMGTNEKIKDASVLIVDDDINILSSLKRLFRPTGYRVLTASDGFEGMEVMGEEAIDLVISDMKMPKMDGAEFLAKVKRKWPDTISILLTGHTDIEATVEAINAGEIFKYVKKPWDDHELLLSAKIALERRFMEAEQKKLVKLLKSQNEDLKDKTSQLEIALSEIETLKGIIPICSYCHQIRDDEGTWNQLEAYISNHSDVDFSHGICPGCYERELDKIKGCKV